MDVSKTVTVAVVMNGLLAGVYFAFACAVTPALGRLDDRSFVEAFRSINTVIQNGWFLTVLFLAPIVTVVAAVLGGVQRHPSFWLLLAAAVCAVLTFVVTVVANVPLNDALDTARTATAGQYETARSAFEHAWRNWNVVRTVTGVAALALLAAAKTG
ncbi:DUF1772 domain-containing protein [Gordonia neofelifaecis]|uniref:DUF1772 domain-containing protein n=1 Tax=Gordonia neofelifaecis NRRL B-59395 TaxID=644548 RepID=F1YJS9_9ACTN|nr:anthrone oxygenase family protein [Gordonia neofelifaecis]EGD55011.1 hypothetical protein SCNU_10796 [Gordonia neofelifaecis NRRL B-59395]